MKDSIEKTKKFEIVCGEVGYNNEKGEIECPSSTQNNKKMLPDYGVPMQEGEMVINIAEARAKYEKDENGKIIKIEFEEKEKAVAGSER